MNYTFELPGEANPLTSQNLYNALRSAASPYQQQIQTGAQQLQTWEKEKGLYSSLQDVFLDQSLPLEIRYLSIIHLKNGIDKYWRKTAQNAVSKEEKSVIRSRALEAGLNEANRRLALQNALVVAKIVRFEFPNDWPDVITTLIAVLRSSTQEAPLNPLRTSRGLLLLLHVVKELSTARLQRSRLSLQSVTPEIIFVLGRIYVEKVQRWRGFLEAGGEDEGGALEDVDQSLLAIKVIRRLLISGYEFPQRENDVREFWGIVRSQLSDFLNLAMKDPQPLSGEVTQLVEKHLLQFSKLHLDMARSHPADFVLLPDSIELARDYWGFIAKYGESFGSKAVKMPAKTQSEAEIDESDKPMAERLSLKGLLLLRACLKMVFNPAQTFKYRKAEEKEEQMVATARIRTDLLEEGLVRQIMEIVVSRFFVFRESDLREWEDDPEEWERKEEGEGDSWEFSIRPCAERLFLDLMINFKDVLVEPLLNVFVSVSNSDDDNILFKDSVYTAIGLSASVLHQHLDFDAFLTSHLANEVQSVFPGATILRRRVAILLGQWVSVKISKDNRPLVYQIYRHLLNRSDVLNDLVVRIAAGRQFKNVADEWEFTADSFLPYAPEVLGRIMALIEEVEGTETKLALLNTVSIVVERMEHEISPYAENIVSLLPPLWEQSGEEHLLKQAILTILTRLINAMKQESRRYHPMVLPLIKFAIEPGSESQVYLMEDALDLWAAVLTQTPRPASSDVVGLAPYLFTIFDQGTENLRKALEITESYLLLAPNEMLEVDMRRRLFHSFTALLENVKNEARGFVTRLIETIIRATEGIDGALEVVAADLVESGLVGKIMDGLRGTWEAHQTTGPNKHYPPLEGLVETDYFNVLARLVLGEPAIFIITLKASRASCGEDVEMVMDWTLSEWFSHFENIGNPANRKLHCLALTRLLETGEKWILYRLQNLMSIWTDVVGELTEGAEDKGAEYVMVSTYIRNVYSRGCNPDKHSSSLVYWDSEGLAPHNPEAPESKRQRQILFQDAVHRVNMVEAIRNCLQSVISQCGGQEIFEKEWLVHVDKDVVHSFGNLGII
ncbi:MAG: hypothetical protein M1837_001924 [Sclerophora amabilis]|nr:MAG: hypothetical protein M1837_001924 [Sclerophora amabilis]